MIFCFFWGTILDCSIFGSGAIKNKIRPVSKNHPVNKTTHCCQDMSKTKIIFISLWYDNLSGDNSMLWNLDRQLITSIDKDDIDIIKHCTEYF